MTILLIILLFLLAYISYIDIKTKKIKNYWSLVNIGIAVVSFFIFHYKFELRYFEIPVLVFIIGVILYFLNIMGAGDVKYLTTFLLIFPYDYQLIYIHKLMISTAVFAITFALIRIISNFKTVIDLILTKNIRALKSVILGSKFAYSPVLFFNLVLIIWEKKII